MIIWINGAFGSGKTGTAYELHRRLPNSFVYDPENVGFFLRKHIPRTMIGDDFQQLQAWRSCNFSILKMIAEGAEGPIIVPMTVVDPLFFDEIVGELRRAGIEVNHYALCASKEVLLGRLKKRFDGPESWAAKQIDRCMEGLSKEVFRLHINTDHLSIDQVVEHIAGHAGLELLPDKRSEARKLIDRLWTQLKQIRF
ncbi:AAA family ATPase [Paenibacillus sp. GCM10027627]|uniref:AAA family ATPase n=1 Tax=unclassified Paenibacillus TaxID=185978 RepID=UPI0036258EF2